ncbi:MAG: acyl-CoA dehydrogenase [Flavobacterium sp.]|jgi:acyl-CoA dehydrogenase
MKNKISFTEEQGMLLDTAMDFCSKNSPINLVRSRIEEEQSLPADLWGSMVELGWTGITIPEAYGGLGLGFSELVPVVEAMGRNLMATPLICSAIAANTLSLAGSESQKSRWLPKIASGAIATIAVVEPSGSWLLDEPGCTGTIEGESIQLTGTKNFVLDATIAEVTLVSIMIGNQARLLLLEKSSIPNEALVREVVIDETRRCYQLTLDGISVSVENLLPVTCFDQIEHAAILLLSAEMAGGHASTLNLIIEYLNTRKQFGRLIGSYQALKHPTVDILVGLEATRSHLYHAATVLDSGSAEDAEIALSMLKAVASEGFTFAGDRAIQFHGGFGFTYECDAQMYLRRALWCQHQFGDEVHHRQLLGQLLID